MPVQAFKDYGHQIETLANSWKACGVTGVILLHHGYLVQQFPSGFPITGEPSVIARHAQAQLELRLYGASVPFWHAMAEAQLEWLAIALTAEAEMESLTGALVETQDRLVAIYEMGKISRGKVVTSEVLDLLVQESVRLLDCKAAFAVVLEPGHEPVTAQSEPGDLPIDFVIDKIDQLYSNPDQQMLSCEWPPTAGLLTLVTVPIRDTVPAVLGLIQRAGQKMTSPDMKLALSIADQSGARLENALLTQAMMSRIRLETEMTVARQVQMTLMPHMLASVPGIDVYGVSVPASQVGGDFFNALPIRGKEFLFYVGDITGKGIPAALMMSMTRTVANSLVRAVPSITPAELVTRINAELGDDYSNVGMFTTLFAGQYQPETRRLDFTNAGHSPVLYAPANEKTRLLMAEDLPVGIVNDNLFSQSFIELNVGDVLVVATDGFNESWNSAREMFGMERLEALLEETKGATALEISAHIFRAVEDFSSGHSADDDRTMLVLKAVPMDGTILITIPATLVELSSVSAALHNLLMRTYGHTLEAQYGYSCELALQELLSNQVIHACQENAELQIDILLEVKVSEHLILMQTYDEGQPNQIDLDHVNMPDPESLSEGGYGLALIHALADQFTYQREGSMNHWKIMKSIPG